MKPSQSVMNWLWGSLLIVMVLLTYTPAMHNDFNWDDDSNIIDNSTLRTLDGLRRIWVEPDAMYQYYPVTHTFFWVEYQLWDLNPFGYHVINILAHAFSALLLWRILLYLRVPAAWMAAAIFALHPVHVESVAWISERKNVLSGFFYLSALLAYLHYSLKDRDLQGGPLNADRKTLAPDSTTRQTGLYLLAVGLFFCAVLSKIVACSLPLAILLLLWWKRGRIGWRDVRALIPMFLFAAVLGGITLWLEKHNVGAQGVDWEFSFVERCLIAGRASWFYVFKFLWPEEIMFVYPRWHIDSGVWWQYLYLLTAVAVVVTLWLMRRRIGTSPLVAVLFFGGTLAPMLGFLDVFFFRYSLVSDHFPYLASISLIALFSAALRMALARVGSWGKYVEYEICAGILLILGILAWNEGYKFQNQETLWRDSVTKNPNSFIAHNNMGSVLAGQGDFKKAIHHYLESLRINPTYPYPYNNLGVAFMAQGDVNEAIRYYTTALKIFSGYVEVRNNLGVASMMQGNVKKAIRHYFEALWLNPSYSKASHNLEDVLTEPKNLDEAIHAARLYVSEEEYDKAFRFYNKILEHQAGSASIIYYHIAALYAKQAKPEDALSSLKEAADRGFNNWALLKSDKDFENIRDSAAFQRFIKELEL